MRNIAMIAGLILTSGFVVTAQETQNPTPRPDQIDTTRPEKATEVEAVHGKIKEVRAGEKIVIDVDNAPDKTYNLADEKRTVRVAEGLAIGDPVKVLESDVEGNKAVEIVRDVSSERGEQVRSRQAEQKK